MALRFHDIFRRFAIACFRRFIAGRFRRHAAAMPFFIFAALRHRHAIFADIILIFIFIFELLSLFSFYAITFTLFFDYFAFSHFREAFTPRHDFAISLATPPLRRLPRAFIIF